MHLYHFCLNIDLPSMGEINWHGMTRLARKIETNDDYAKLLVIARRRAAEEIGVDFPDSSMAVISFSYHGEVGVNKEIQRNAVAASRAAERVVATYSTYLLGEKFGNQDRECCVQLVSELIEMELNKDARERN